MRKLYLCLFLFVGFTLTVFASEPSNVEEDVSFGVAVADLANQANLAFTKFRADTGNARAQHLVATAYRLGTHGDVDIELSKHFLNKAIAENYAPAIAEMAHHYRYGTLNTKMSTQKALAARSLAGHLREHSREFRPESPR